MTFEANIDRIQAEDQTMRVLTAEETEFVSGAGKVCYTKYRLNGKPKFRVCVED